ncbi:MAG: glycosyltransferase [Proteobacteria bacterium]|nr:glycosyltransferase [Pseudomonadota bacterium]
MKKPLISIITVSFNSQNTIERTIQSVLSQDYTPIEYIIVDGASSDQTSAIIKKYQNKLALFICEPDEGIYDAMNKGIRSARGEVIGLLNADDIYAHPFVISKVAKAIMPYDACYGDLIYFKDKDPNNVVRYWRSSEFKQGAFAKGWSPPHPTFFVKRHIYSQYGLFNTNYSMGNDVELMMRFLEKHQIKSCYIPEVLVKMQLGGVSNAGLKNIFIQNKNILRAARSLNIPLSPLTYVFYKFFNRAMQFIQKPSRGSLYVK